MKSYVIIFLIVLAFSCSINELSGGGFAPVGIPVSVTGVSANDSGVRRIAQPIPPINYTDAGENSGYIKTLSDNENRESSESQMGSNF